MTVLSTPLSAARFRTLRRCLREAQEEHDIIRRARCSGASNAALASDHRRWEMIGAAIAGLAALIVEHCAASAFCDARPARVLLTARLSEAVDDLLDEPAWRVIDAAARLADAEPAGRCAP